MQTTRVQNAENPCTKYKNTCTEYRKHVYGILKTCVQNTKNTCTQYRIQNIEYRLQNTVYLYEYKTIRNIFSEFQNNIQLLIRPVAHA